MVKNGRLMLRALELARRIEAGIRQVVALCMRRSLRAIAIGGFTALDIEATHRTVESGCGAAHGPVGIDLS